MTPWCIVIVCSWRRLLADRHSLPFPWTLSLHRRWCPRAQGGGRGALGGGGSGRVGFGGAGVPVGRFWHRHRPLVVLRRVGVVARARAPEPQQEHHGDPQQHREGGRDADDQRRGGGAPRQHDAGRADGALEVEELHVGDDGPRPCTNGPQGPHCAACDADRSAQDRYIQRSRVGPATFQRAGRKLLCGGGGGGDTEAHFPNPPPPPWPP